MSRVRAAASRGNVDPELVEQAVAQAEKNLMDKSKAFDLMTGQMSLQDLFPEILENNEALQGSEALEETSKIAVDATLEIVKGSFLSSMDNYVRSMYLDVSTLVTIDDPEYDPIATMKFLRATNNLLKIQNFNISGQNFEDQRLTARLRSTILRLCDDYETVDYNGFKIYKSQLEPLRREDVTDADAARDAEANEINTALKGSLVFGEDLSQEIRDRGVEGLINVRTIRVPGTADLLREQEEYQSIFAYLFPMYLDISELDEDATEAAGERRLSEDRATDTLSTWRQWTLNRYQGESGYFASDDPRFNLDPRNVSLNLSYLKTISALVNRFQQDIEQNLEKVFNVLNKEKLLEVIKDFYNIELEAQRQVPGEDTQLISTSLLQNGTSTTLEHPVEGLLVTNMADSTVDRNHISNITTIQDQFFLGSADQPTDVITLCEQVPEQYKDFFDQEADSNPLRRKVFREQITKVAKEMYESYREENTVDFEELDDIGETEDFETTMYLDVFEGVLEQMVGYMGESRLFNDAEYVSRLDAKVRSRRYFEEVGPTACIINPLNSFDEGAIKFKEIVSEIFPKQYASELSDPSNSVYTLDYTKPGPFEKAMMTTSVLGFIRIVCLEALMKGAVAYSSWDIDFVQPDPLFKEYIFRLVENNIEREETFSKYRVLVDDALRKLTVTNNRSFAIRNLVNNEMANSISILCKILFENDSEQNYVNWFLNKMFVVDAPVDRRVTIDNSGEPKPEWVSKLSYEQISKYRQNSFTYFERYIRTNGLFNDVLPPLDGLAEAQKNALFDFIRFDGFQGDVYSNSFYKKLYNPSDPEFLAVPIALDIPTTEETNSFDIGNQENLITIDPSTLDNDQWPEKELYSLEDFNDLMRAIFNNNPGVQKYIFHLLKKYYDEEDTESILHGKPKTLVRKLPVKAIQRKRMHYTFDRENDFTNNFTSQFEPIIPNGAGGLLPRSQKGKEFTDYIEAYSTTDLDRSLRISGTEPKPYGSDKYQFLKFEDRFYISGMPGEEALDNPEALDASSMGYTIKQLGDDQGFPEAVSENRGLCLPRSPWSEQTNNAAPEDVSSGDSPDRLVCSREPWINNVPGLAPTQILFNNKTGEVTEQEYNDFVSLTDGVLETETWEEYVIDLVDDAAPIFTQMGISGFDHNGFFSDDQRRRIGMAAEKGYGMSRERPEVLAGFFNEDDTADEDMPAGTVFKFFGTLNRTETDRMVSRAVIFKGPDYEEPPEYSNRGSACLGHTLWDNSTTSVQDPQLNVWRLSSRAEQVLGHNEYKVPLRILLTQVRDSEGNITRVFSRYLIPKFLTFSEDDSTRAEKLTRAAEQTAEGYVELFLDTLREAQNSADERSNVMRRSVPGRYVYGEDNEWNNSALWQKNIWRTDAVTYLYGLGFPAGNNISPGDGGNTPVFGRTAASNLPHRSSTGPQFVSISKLWSLGAHTEANSKAGHFVVDTASDTFETFDQFFNDNPGKLMRKPKSLTRMTGFAYDADIMVEDESFPGDAANKMGIQHASLDERREIMKRGVAYHNSSIHFLYENSFEDLVDRHSDDLVTSLGNMVGWFGQRRVDGIFGATSKNCSADFSISGLPSSNRARNAGVINAITVANSVFQEEAPDFLAGGSLFYGDNRVLIEKYLPSLKRDILKQNPGFNDTALKKFYKTQFDKFRLRNLWKLSSTYLQGEGPGIDFRNGTNSPQYFKDDTVLWNIPGTLTNRKTEDNMRMQIFGLNAFLQHIEALSFRSDSEYDSIDDSIFGGNDDTRRYSLTNVSPTLSDTLLRFFDVDSLEISTDPVFDTPNRSDDDVNPPSGLPFGEFEILKDKTFAEEGEDPFQPTPRGSNFSGIFEVRELGNVSLDTHNNNLKNVAQAPNNDSHFALYSQRISEEQQQYPVLLSVLSDRFDQVLRHADGLIDALYRILAGLNSNAIDLLEQLEVRHGLRLNIAVTDQKMVTNVDGTIIPMNYRSRDFIDKLFNDDTEIGEEERIGRIHVERERTDEELFQDSSELYYSSYTSVPLAFHERLVFSEDVCDPVINYFGIPDLIRSRDSEMIQAISEVEEFKTFFDFAVPYRRIGSLLTIHSTSMLAGYSSMPGVLTSTKAALAGTFSLMAERNTFDALSSNQFGERFTNIDIAASMGGGFPSGGEPPECFALPDAGPWFTMIWEMIKQFVKYFPAVVLRGIADDIDPAYKEMKSHFYACEIPSLKMDSIGYRSGNDKTEFGLRGGNGQGNYIPIFPGFPIDLGIGMSRLIPPGSDGGEYLGKALDRMVSYTIGGPQQLIDASYAFQIPCEDIIDRTGTFRDWEKYQIGKYGRYGHPMTPITYAALKTRHLPRDVRYKEQVCRIQDMSRRGVTPRICDDTEE